MENYEKDLDLLFDLKQKQEINKNFNENNNSNIDFIVDKYTEIMHKFLFCYEIIKSEM